MLSKKLVLILLPILYLSCASSSKLDSKLLELDSAQIDNIYYATYAYEEFMVGMNYFCDSAKDYYDYNDMEFSCEGNEISLVDTSTSISIESALINAKEQGFNFLLLVINTENEVDAEAGFPLGFGNNMPQSSSLGTSLWVKIPKVSAGMEITLISLSDGKSIWTSTLNSTTKLVGQQKEIGISVSKLVMKKLREDGLLSEDFYMPRVIYN